MTLIIGQTGQLGRALARARPDAMFLDRAALDLCCDEDAIRAALDAVEPPVPGVIIAAAYTRVDDAEDDADTAHIVNARAPGIIARWCAEAGLPVVYPSTDYVFSGTGERPWEPGDTTDPLNAYGRSKLAGERAVAESGARHVILRTSWVYDSDGRNFLTTMLRLGAERDRVQVVSDQIGRPTHADDLARACLSAVDGNASGIFHVSGSGPFTSWAGFARHAFEAARHDCRVDEVPSSHYPTKAERPKNSRLDISAFEQVFGASAPDWRGRVAEAALSRESRLQSS